MNKLSLFVPSSFILGIAEVHPVSFRVWKFLTLRNTQHMAACATRVFVTLKHFETTPFLLSHRIVLLSCKSVKIHQGGLTDTRWVIAYHSCAVVDPGLSTKVPKLHGLRPKS